jgi:hypothetical protein
MPFKGTIQKIKVTKMTNTTPAMTAETKNLMIDVAALETTDQTAPAIDPEARLDTNAVIAAGLRDHVNGKNSALRALIWFSYGFHVASEKDSKTAAQFLIDLKAKLIANGDVRSDYETKIKRAKMVGTNFRVTLALPLNRSD